MKKRCGVFVYGSCLIFLSGSMANSAEELIPNFRLDFQEIGFSDGKYFRVIPLTCNPANKPVPVS